MRALPLLALFAAIFLVQIAGNPEILTEQGVVGHSPFESESANFIDMPTTLGAIIVFFFYWFKFNDWAGEGVAPLGYRPRPARHFTTWLRYLGWNTFYGLFMAGNYAVIVFFPELIYAFLAPYTTAAGNISGPTSAAIDTFLNILMTDNGLAQGAPVEPAQLAPYAVMLTTVVWAGMRPFSEFEKRFRLSLQEHAAIPRQAKLLTDNFFEEDTNFKPDHEIIQKVVKQLNGHPLTSDDFTDPGDNKLWFLYARTVYLNYLLQKYNRRPVFSKLAERYVHEFKDLELKINNLNDLVLQRIAEIENLVSIDKTDANQKKNPKQSSFKTSELLLQSHLNNSSDSRKKYFEGQKKQLIKEINSTTKDVVQLIVCGVLAVGKSSAQRRDLLEAFGIKQGRGTSQLDSITITWIAIGSTVITFLCSAAYYMGIQHLSIENVEILKKFPRNINNALYWSLITCVMHLCAIAGGFFLQRTLETNRKRLQVGRRRRRLTPRTQVAEGVWSACIGFSLNVYLIGGIAVLSDSFETLVHTWWWALVPAVTAFFAALYTQEVDQTELNQEKRLQKGLRSLENTQNLKLKRLFWLQGIATGAMAIFIFLITNEKFIWGEFAKELSADETLAIVYFGIYVALTSIILGLALAKFLHMWISAEKFTGKQERRRGKRHKHLFKLGKWHTNSGEQLIRAIEISSSGAEIKASPPLKLDSEGKIKLNSKEPRPAKVVGIRGKDSSHCYIKFLDNAA